MIVDVVCLTNTSSENEYGLTERTIKSLRLSEKNITFNIILVESNKNTSFIYDNVDVYLKPDSEFNYNKYLNISNDYLTSEWILITNNDVRYEKNWFTEILEVYNKRPDIESFSPKEILFYSTIFDSHFDGGDNYWESYKVTESVMGWSLVMRKRVWDEIYPWDENFDFYYQDNDYAKTIESKGIKHAVVRDSLTLHIGNINFFKSNVDEDRDKKMEKDCYKFIKKWNN